jgi:hypothetical protein
MHEDVIILDIGTHYGRVEIIAAGLQIARAARLETNVGYAAPSIAKFAAMCHSISYQRGWYTNPTTGEALTRNTGELIALMHSEVSECWEALVAYPGEPDEKCPDHFAFAVEIADAMIRVSDTLGARGYDMDKIVSLVSVTYPDFYRKNAVGADKATRLMGVHLALSYALEADRKGRESDLGYWLVIALLLLADFAWSSKVEIGDVIFDKCHYNLGRQDHALENRKQAGGKAY